MVIWQGRRGASLADQHNAQERSLALGKLYRRLKTAMAKRDTKVGDLCKELGVTRQTLYRFVDPKDELRADGMKLPQAQAPERQLVTKQAEWRLVTRLVGLGPIRWRR